MAGVYIPPGFVRVVVIILLKCSFDDLGFTDCVYFLFDYLLILGSDSSINMKWLLYSGTHLVEGTREDRSQCRHPYVGGWRFQFCSQQVGAHKVPIIKSRHCIVYL